ncbi:hypothetical protein EVAR_99162_1 [Eumeta japonica]|uniref:Uncharacterized protein n=1 Tax=Eumeta variegata TaxID=151549 RepID=A0A4C1SBT5_EUMVA|nr:hypothetical protein EVAR_99162_1 [Eumeta japonica]
MTRLMALAYQSCHPPNKPIIYPVIIGSAVTANSIQNLGGANVYTRYRTAVVTQPRQAIRVTFVSYSRFRLFYDRANCSTTLTRTAIRDNEWRRDKAARCRLPAGAPPASSLLTYSLNGDVSRALSADLRSSRPSLISVIHRDDLDRLRPTYSLTDTNCDRCSFEA